MSRTDKRQVQIRVDDVKKHFTLRHTHSLKETVVWTLRGRATSQKHEALKGVSFDILQGETVGLLGHNGSGKSTLLKVLSGVLNADSGRVGIRGRVAGLIEVGAGFHPDLTGMENIHLNAAILGMSPEEIEQVIEPIIEFSELERKFIDNEVKFYSSGMFMRLAFAVAVHTHADIFLIDEVLAVGDAAFQEKSLAKIRELSAQGRTLVVVSHDLDKVEGLCDRGIVLDHGSVVFDGSGPEAVAQVRGT